MPSLTNSATAWARERFVTTERAIVYAAAMVLCAEAIFASVWWYQRWILENTALPPVGWDFVVYWHASALAQARGALAAYDWELMRAAQAPVLEVFGPFAYPPAYLGFIYPIAGLPLWQAIVLFSAAGYLLYILMLRRALRGVPAYWLIPALAFPGAWTAILAGQNSLFTSAAAGAALLLMRRNAVAAGACIALLSIKPQLGVLFPLMLLCERRWAVMASAATCCALIAFLTVLAFGIDIYPAFFDSLRQFRGAVAEHGGYTLRAVPTVFGVCRTLGMDVPVAYGLHAIVAMSAAGLCAWLWSTGSRPALSASALVAGTLLVQPYMVYYDLAWLALPLAFLSADMSLRGSDLAERSLLAAAWLAPAQALVAAPLSLPQVTPAILFLVLCLACRRHAMASRNR